MGQGKWAPCGSSTRRGCCVVRAATYRERREISRTPGDRESAGWRNLLDRPDAAARVPDAPVACSGRPAGRGRVACERPGAWQVLIGVRFPLAAQSGEASHRGQRQRGEDCGGDHYRALTGERTTPTATRHKSSRRARREQSPQRNLGCTPYAPAARPLAQYRATWLCALRSRRSLREPLIFV